MALNRQRLVDATVERGICKIQMQDEAGRNALDRAFMEQLKSAFELADQDCVHVAILSGLPDLFCRGASRATLQEILDGSLPVAELDLPHLLLDCSVPVIAAMAGDAVGGGFALGISGDLVILAEERRYGFNFMDLGLTPGMGATVLAREALGKSVADELLYTGEYRRGKDFRGKGSINYIVPSAAVLELAENIALRIADKPASAVRSLKSALVRERKMAFLEARKIEEQMHRQCLQSPEIAQRISSNYVE